MSKLDRIEALKDRGPDGPILVGRTHFDLLIRTARQLGAKQLHEKNQRSYWDGKQYRPIDPDVLDLIAPD